MVQQTSLEAYTELMLSQRLGDMQKMVYSALLVRGALNNRLLSVELRKPINTITPRVLELRKLGLVREHSRARDYVTGKVTIYWEAVHRGAE